MINNTNKPVVSILGCGYVGLTTAALLANCGVRVNAIEVDDERLNIILQGRSFFYEAGLDALIKKGITLGTLVPTNTYNGSISDSDVVFSCVGTPDNPDGSSNLTYVFEAAKMSIKYMKSGAIFVQKSTVPVGTGAKVEKIFNDSGKAVTYVSSPEFLREGTAIADTLWPDRIVIGSQNKDIAEQIAKVYKLIESSAARLARDAKLSKPKITPETSFIYTTRNSAELIKVTANAFLAMKITFANSIAKLADNADANIQEVMNAVGADRRIGQDFLNAGRGYGGGCFPKDVSGLIRSASDYGVNMEIMETVSNVNGSMPHYIVNKAEQALGGSFNTKNIAVLGLAFKAGTSDVRRSPAVTIANSLVQKGAKVKAYDPEAMEEARNDSLDNSVKLCGSLEEAVSDVDCIFVATDWPEFRDMDLVHVVKLSKAQLLVDCMNCIDSAPSLLPRIGIGQN